MRKARAKVRERGRGIWTRMETVGREARAADGAAVKTLETATAGADAKQEKQAHP